MEILGSGKEENLRISVIFAETQGINVKVGNPTGYLVYELKVPLTQNKQHPYAIGIDTSEIDTSKSISIGFETPELDMEMMGKRMDGGMRPRGGIPGSRRPPSGRGRMPERFQLWATVKLASVPK